MTVCPPQNHQRPTGLRSREPGEHYDPSPAKNTPLLPGKKGTGAERAVGWPGGIRPRLSALRPERRAFMTVCPPQNHQRPKGLRSREPGEGYDPSPAENTPLLPEKGNRCRASGGAARRDPSSTQRSPAGTADLYGGLSPTKPPTTDETQEPGAGRTLRPFARQKHSPPPREEGVRCRASGGVDRRDPSSIRRTPSQMAGLYDSLSPTKPPTTDETQEPGAGRTLRPFARENAPLLPEKENRCRASGGV